MVSIRDGVFLVRELSGPCQGWHKDQPRGSQWLPGLQ